MGTKAKFSSFNPSWCLRPPPIKAPTPRFANGNSRNKSPLPSKHHPTKSHHHRHRSLEPTVEPTSPRVGCMGKVRRHKAPGNSSSGQPLRSTSISPQFNLLMLKKSANVPLNTPSPPPSKSWSPGRLNVGTGEFSLLMLKRVSSMKVYREEMDPPRTVERKQAKPEGLVSLWKRRCGGGADGLRLQLQPAEQICV